MAKRPPKKHDLTKEERRAFINEIGAEADRGSTRAVVLVSVSVLDEVLRRALQRFFVDTESTNELLNGGANAPLGSFSARIKVAESLGLLSAQEADLLNALRGIRNDYAHRLESELDERSLQDRLDFQRKKMNDWINVEDAKIAPTDDFRLTYAKICMAMVQFMMRRMPWIEEHKCAPRKQMRLKAKDIEASAE